jgi:hypothetical protein
MPTTAMTLTINFKSEGEYTERVRNLDHGLDRAEEIAEMSGMRSRYNLHEGTVTLTGEDRMFFGYVA